MIRNALSFAWRTWAGNWFLLCAIIAVTYWPLDLLQSYIEYHWFAPDDLRRSFKLSRFFDQFFLIVPDAAIYYVALLWLHGEKSSMGEALGAGLRNYGRMWCTRFLVYLSYLTIFLFIFPGVYLLTRWSMAEVCAVAEERLGTGAFGCSWLATQERFWQVFRALCVGALIMICFAAIPVWISFAFPDLWWIDGVSSMAMSIFLPFSLLYEVGIYVQLLEQMEPTTPLSER